MNNTFKPGACDRNRNTTAVQIWFSSCTFMMLQKNADINVMTHEERKDDVENITANKDIAKELTVRELKWRPAKKAEDGRRVVPLLQVIGREITKA